jgi:photosystem I subunit 11
MVSFIKPYRQDPFVGHLATPITTSAFTRAYLRILPAYRPGLTPLSRGAEIGFTHGYFLVGPFYTFGPLRSAEFSVPSLAAGLLAAITLLLILTIGLSIYGQVTYEVYDNPLVVKVVRQFVGSEKTSELPKIKRATDLDSLLGWQKFSEGFFSGGLIGSVVAALGITLYSTYF